MARILLVDDEAPLVALLAALFRDRGHEVTTATSGEQALAIHERTAIDAAVLDVCLPGIPGLETFQRLRSRDRTIEGLFMTGHATIRDAVAAIQAGGFHYLEKPVDNQELLLILDRAVERRQLLTQVTDLRHALAAREAFGALIGESPVMHDVRRRLAKVAVKDVAVLITGETGTGKEIAARLVHRASPRAAGPFVPVNCGAIAPTLAESTLFGHVRGAFTDARSDRRGVFEQARDGVLFLDEVGELPVNVQAMLLRVLEEHTVTRVGDDKALPVNVRVIAATHRDLRPDQTVGGFRQDLFHRLNGFSVSMPPLRERLEDLPVLVHHLLDRANATCQTRVGSVTPAALACLREYPWPGNVRELANALHQAVIEVDGPTIDAGDLPAAVRLGATGQIDRSPETLAEYLQEAERLAIEATLARFHGNRTASAEALGISRKTFFNKVRKFRNRLNLADNDQ